MSAPLPRRIIICGSRRWRDRDKIIDRLADLEDPGSVTIVHGGAKGADRIAVAVEVDEI